MLHLQGGVTQDNHHRPMDLRAASSAVAAAYEAVAAEAVDDAAAPAWKLRLAVGSQVAAEARAAVKVSASVSKGCMVARSLQPYIQHSHWAADMKM